MSIATILIWTLSGIVVLTVLGIFVIRNYVAIRAFLDTVFGEIMARITTLMAWLASVFPQFNRAYLQGLAVIMAIAVAWGLYRYYSHATYSIPYTNYVHYIGYLVLAMAGLVGLAAFANIFYGWIHAKHDGIFGFVISVIFFLPCLFNDLVAYLMQQYAITSSATYVLFIIEMICILLYMYVPALINKLVTANGEVLLKMPVGLDTVAYVSHTDNTAFNAIYNLSAASKPLLNYSISLWIFINPQNSANSPAYSDDTTETTIFTYGYSDGINQYYKPKIAYNAQKQTYIVYFTNGSSGNAGGNSFEINTTNMYEPNAIPRYIAPNQKWNNFVFNYSGGAVDLFINGVLEKTFALSNVPVHSQNDIISVGENNGLDGAVCNVMFFRQALSQPAIVSMYNIQHLKTPPIA